MSIDSINRSEIISQKSKEASTELHENVRALIDTLYLSKINKKGNLVLIPGKKCWLLNVDVFFLGQLDYCYIDHICLAIKVAFYDLEIPKLNVVHNQLLDEDDIDLVDENASNFQKFDMRNFPSLCTIGQVIFIFLFDFWGNLFIIIIFYFFINFLTFQQYFFLNYVVRKRARC